MRIQGAGKPHIVMGREDVALDRRLGGGGGRPKERPVDPGGHGRRLARAFDGSISSLVAKRRSAGIASDRLLVIELQSSDIWNETVRAKLETLFDAYVVEDRAVGVGKAERSKLVVQFASADGLARFREELGLYSTAAVQGGQLTAAQRRDLFDLLTVCRALNSEDRTGPRLKKLGLPEHGQVALDVDLWHPGSTDLARLSLTTLRKFCTERGGRVADEVRTPSLLVTRVLGPHTLGQALLELDIVSRIDLPPELPIEHVQISSTFEPPSLPPVPADMPAVCVIDSGVLSAHPLLAGWVLAERDFGSGEGTVSDTHGHGTAVAGLVAYSDFAGGITEGRWQPRVPIYSAKVLHAIPDFPHAAPEFPLDQSPVALVARAIEHFKREHGCRIFNLSIGNTAAPYDDGRQPAWAEMLDQLAREHDIVVVVSAGNAVLPIPNAAQTREAFQAEVRDRMLDDASVRICDPATAALALAVGSIARLGDVPHVPGRERANLVGAPAGAPSPFSRVGPGYRGKAKKAGIKPDFVAHGGNLAVTALAGDVRWERNPVLDEITLGIDGLLRRCHGTSFAAARVSQSAALAMRVLKSSFGEEPSANAVRALMGCVSGVPSCGFEWLRDPGESEADDKLRLVGHGTIDGELLLESVENDVVIIAEDKVGVDQWHVYYVPVPEAFIGATGRRGVTVALAFDPPVRGSRREYLARTMDLEIIKNRSVTDISRARDQANKQTESNLKDKYRLDAQPTLTAGERSTLQVRRKVWKRRADFDAALGFHVFVQCHKRFATDNDDQPQAYGLAVRLWTEDKSVKVHEHVSARVRARVRTRVRQ